VLIYYVSWNLKGRIFSGDYRVRFEESLHLLNRTPIVSGGPWGVFYDAPCSMKGDLPAPGYPGKSMIFFSKPRQMPLLSRAVPCGPVLPALLALACLALLSACYPSLPREASRPGEALRKVHFFSPPFTDDMDFESLAVAVERNLLYLERLPDDTVFFYGSSPFTCRQVMESQRALLDLLSREKRPSHLNRKIRKLFFIYKATGRAGNSKVLFTGYFEPTFEAKLVRDSTFKYPIYRKPRDLIKIDLSRFREKFKGESIVGRLAGGTIVPYYTRLQIEAEKALEGKGLEIAWLKDPVDVAFLQIQGSGLLVLPGNRHMRVGYSGSNGHPYRSIGRYLIDNGLLEREKISMQSIRKFLATHPALVQKILNYNPSYVFFRVLERGPLGNIGVPLTPGRSIATSNA